MKQARVREIDLRSFDLALLEILVPGLKGMDDKRSGQKIKGGFSEVGPTRANAWLAESWCNYTLKYGRLQPRFQGGTSAPTRQKKCFSTNGASLPLIGSRSKVSEVLAGTRPLSVRMIRALHEQLGIPAEVLLREPGGRMPEELPNLRRR